MTPLDVTSILDDKSRPWFHVCQLNLDRTDASAFFAVDAVVADEPGLGDADYWAVKFDCGLELIFELFHFVQAGSIFADLPSAQHTHRHLRHWDSELVDVPREMQEQGRRAMIERFADDFPELLEVEGFQVWRQGDDGNQVKIGTSTTKRDADCWVAEFESHHHKQIYWVSRSTAG
ncbi:MAG: hypothetical protein AAFU85_05055 [Planctomycetota bacterium]